MIEIQKLTRYKFDGSEFNSLDAVKTHVENNLGALIDKMSNSLKVPLSTEQRLQMFDAVVSNKEELKKLLSIEYDNSDEWDRSNMINILDF